MFFHSKSIFSSSIFLGSSPPRKISSERSFKITGRIDEIDYKSYASIFNEYVYIFNHKMYVFTVFILNFDL